MSTDTGLLPVDKPAGPTSHDVVAAARRTLGIRRIGHTGTLDPFASGLLLLLLGPATRLAEYLSDFPKTYHATLRLGAGTDTDDRTGTVITEADPSGLREADVRAALEEQVGQRLQRPPAYSAKKVAGTRAYHAARAGEALELEPVPVRVDSIVVRSIDGPVVDFEVVCGAGTYIRAIARDAGERLGVPAHLTALRRTAIGPWSVDRAVPLAGLDPETARAAAVAPLDALRHLTRIDLDAEQAEAVSQGRRPPAPEGTPAGPLVLAAGGRLLGVGELIDGRLAPRKVFHG